MRHQTNVAFNGEMGEEPCFLDDVADTAAKANLIPIERGTPFHPNFTRGRLEQAINELECGSFAGSAAAEERQRFAAVHIQVDVGK